MSDRQPDTGLERRLGLISATLGGIGVILGAGIYVLVGAAAGQAGNAVWLSFVIAAVSATLTGISYARLGKLHPKDAPEFQYLSLAFGRLLAFLAGWLVLWVSIISASAVALGFAGYLHHLVGAPQLPAAIVLIVFSALVVFLGIGQSALLAGVLTLVEIAGLVFIIFIGLPHAGGVNLIEAPNGIAGVVGAAALVFFAYVGFESIANFSEEMKNPQRDLPIAIFLAVGVTTLLYILVSLAAVGVMGWSALSQSTAPLAAVAERARGAGADLLLTFIALASTANTVLLLLLAASRSMWAMSCAGVLPANFCVIGRTRRTPWLAILLVTFFASLFAVMKNIEEVASLTNFAILLAFIGVNASAIKLFNSGNSRRRFSGVIINSGLPAAGIAVSLFLAVNTGWNAVALGGALLLAGLGIYLARTARG
ncbi:MAG: amino acid permease [Chloroflexi bacterium]|nr:amino acid permease [Chloroflexota bacterium]